MIWFTIRVPGCSKSNPEEQKGAFNKNRKWTPDEKTKPVIVDGRWFPAWKASQVPSLHPAPECIAAGS